MIQRHEFEAWSNVYTGIYMITGNNTFLSINDSFKYLTN